MLNFRRGNMQSEGSNEWFGGLGAGRRAVMSLFQRVLGMRLSSERFDVRLGQLLCFAAGPLLLVVALGGLARLALTPGEAFIGVLASLAMALLLVILGIVLPLASGAPPKNQCSSRPGPGY